MEDPNPVQVEEGTNCSNIKEYSGACAEHVSKACQCHALDGTSLRTKLSTAAWVASTSARVMRKGHAAALQELTSCNVVDRTVIFVSGQIHVLKAALSPYLEAMGSNPIAMASP